MTNALKRGEGSASRPGRSLPRERPSTHCTGGWVGPRAGLDRCGKSHPHRDSIPGRPARSSVAIPTELPGPQLHHVLQLKYNGWSTVASCDGQEVLLCEKDFSVKIYLLRSVRKFYFMLAINRTPNKWLSMESDRHLHFFDRPICFLCKLLLDFRNSHPRCQSRSFAPE